MGSKIFQVLSEAEPFSEYYGGGTSRWTANVVKDDADTIVVCPEADDTWDFPTQRVRLVPELLQYRQILKLTKHREPWPIKRLLLHRVLSRGLKDLATGDIVWIQNRPEFAAAIGPFVKKRRAKLVLHMHNSHIVSSPPQFIRSLHADRIVFCSKFLRDESLEKYPHLQNISRVVVNGADDTVFFPVSTEKKMDRISRPPIILFVGRLVPEKGVHVLLGAMRILHQRGVLASARIVGGANFGHHSTTPYVEELHRNATPNVQFCGYVDLKALGDQFREADIFCCPSIWKEAFGAINVEAMACALPVVATKTGGIPEVFAEGGGILVPPNSEQELASALEHLALNSSQRDRLSQMGYTSFRKNFTWHAVHQQYRNVIESLRA